MRFLQRRGRRSAVRAERIPPDEDDADWDADAGHAGAAGHAGSAGDGDGLARGGYLFVGEPDATGLRLAEPVRSTRQTDVRVTGPAAREVDLRPGQYYLIGGPGQSSCEVVLVETREPGLPAGPRRVRRSRFGTVVSTHPAGAEVTPVTAERVEDWSRWTPDEGCGGFGSCG